MGRIKIGIAVIAKNEADRIGRLLASASFADELVVVDSGSTDGTRDLCRDAGAKVVANPWPGYARQKQFALDAMNSDWILNLDADEAVSRALADEIRKAVASVGPDVAGFSMPRLSRYLGRWIKHGGWYPDRKVRLVRRGKATWSGDALHEKLLVDGRIQQLSSPILHHVYRSISDQLRTIDKFSGIYATDRGIKGGWFVVAGVFHAIGKLLECFIWKRGFLDGTAGLVIAMNSAGYVFLKHAKSWESGLKDP